MDFGALALTLRLSAATTMLLLFVALPLGLWLGAKQSASRAVLQAIITLPVVLPPTVLGFYLLVGLGPRTGVGRLLIAILGHPLAFTFSGLLVGSAIYSLPFAVQPIVAARQSLAPGLLEAAQLLGAPPFQVLWRVVLPVLRPSILASAVLVFAHTMGEFGVVLMLGGNIPGATRTLSVSLFDLVEEGRVAEANQTALLLLAVSLLTLLALYAGPFFRDFQGARREGDRHA